MEQEEKNIDLIEAYASGELTGSDLVRFEEKCSVDPAFAREVTDYLLIMKEIRSSHERAFTEKVKGWESEIDKQGGRASIIPMRRILAIAASLLIIAAATGYFTLQFFSPQNSEALFAMHFKPYEDVISERSGGQSSLTQGMDLYNQGEYANAIPYLKKYLDENPSESAVTCYLAISYLANNEIHKAQDLFEGLVFSGSELYKQIAEWNLALIYLKLNNKELLKSSVNAIMAQKDHLYAGEARALYEQL